MNPANRKFMIDTLPIAIEEMRKIYAGTAYTSRMVEAVVPYIGIGREDETGKLLKKLGNPDIDLGTKKGLEYLEAYSALARAVGK